LGSNESPREAVAARSFWGSDPAMARGEAPTGLAASAAALFGQAERDLPETVVVRRSLPGLAVPLAMDHPSFLSVAHGAGRLALAAGLGSTIGIDRTLRGKSAGMRTHALVAMGAALLAYTAAELVAVEHYDSTSVARVVQGLITGIGFLGAGVILHDRAEHVRGLTTAAAIWLDAAIGAACGAGELAIAVVATVFSLALLLATPLERWLQKHFGPSEKSSARHDDDS
jgi:putative Mg2+ transporter-C (MgtC) family protein